MRTRWGIVFLVLAACGSKKPALTSSDELASLDAGTEPTWEGESGTPSTAPEGGTPVAEIASGTDETSSTSSMTNSGANTSAPTRSTMRPRAGPTA